MRGWRTTWRGSGSWRPEGLSGPVARVHARDNRWVMRGATVTFTQLRTFALVAELGSLRAAAAALGVSEPAVSAAVSALRSDLGDPLFQRCGSGIVLTPGGRAL